MSQILSGLILAELQKSNPNPQVASQQQQLANAIAVAVSRYLNTNVTVATTGGPGRTIAP